MMSKRLRAILIGGYVALALSAVGYELGIRLYDRGNSEFAGMLSTVLTLPASLLLIAIGKALGVNVGDSDASFVVILGLSVLVNAGIAWLIIGMLSRRK